MTSLRKIIYHGIVSTLLLEYSCTGAFAEYEKYEEDRVTRWQIEDARAGLKDRESQLLSKIDDLKSKLWTLNVQLNEVLRDKKYAEQDLHDAQRDLLDIKMKLL